MFALLYGKSKSDKIKTWCISIVKEHDKSLIVIRHGYKDGRLIESIKEITKGKNLNKANETTHYEQAYKEALAKWNKKKEEGYTENMEDILKIDSSPNLFPMLAFDYSKYKNNIFFPCYIQPKKDGVRCVYYNNNLYSRKLNMLQNFQNILQELSQTDTTLILDGELINENISFQEFTGLVNKKPENVTELDRKKLDNTKFYIFDCIMTNISFENRYRILIDFFNHNKFKNIKLLKTEICKNAEGIENKLKEYTNNGDEGIIIRNKEGLYTNFRSKNLLKYKTFFDKEYTIVNFKQGEGNHAGCVIWVCKTESGKLFDVTPKGTLEERKVLYLNGNKYIGKLLTVKYQEFFEDSDIPRFGVGISIRDYE